MDAATVATFVVAAGTLVLAVVTWLQGRRTREQVAVARQQTALARDELALARDSFMLSTRPLLADAVVDGAVMEGVQFGPPGRHLLNVARHGFIFERDYGGALLCSVPFRNIGGGLAVIGGVSVAPAPLGDAFYTRKFVPPGEVVRINISTHVDPSMSDPLTEACRTVGLFVVTINYSDADGQQRLISRAELREYATAAMSVRQIAVFRDGDADAFAVSGSCERKVLGRRVTDCCNYWIVSRQMAVFATSTSPRSRPLPAWTPAHSPPQGTPRSTGFVR